MRITNIRESGSNATLMWAINNGANVKSDTPLVSVCNDELVYLVTLADVNFLELFRLTQLYREKLRIVDMHPIAMPDRAELSKQFNGNYEVAGTEDQETQKAPLGQLVELAITPFMNVAKQMGVDNDIISPNAEIMFIPMICRKFDVQIPVAFYSVISAMTDDEANAVYNAEYPATLQKIIETEVHGVKTAITMDFIKTTQIPQYNTRYNQYLHMLKYAPLKKAKGKGLCKFSLLGFHKYDNMSRGDVRVNLLPTPPTAEQFGTMLKRLATLTTPLMVDFAVSMPLQYMQVLENVFSREDLIINYEASMTTILDGNLVYEDFNIPQYGEDMSPEQHDNLERVNNAITAYKVRIGEANQCVLNALPTILDNEGDVDITGAFAMLPSIYTTKAVLTLDVSKAKKYMDVSDPVLSEMFRDIFQTANGIMADINKAK